MKQFFEKLIALVSELKIANFASSLAKQGKYSEAKKVILHN